MRAKRPEEIGLVETDEMPDDHDEACAHMYIYIYIHIHTPLSLYIYVYLYIYLCIYHICI